MSTPCYILVSHSVDFYAAASTVAQSWDLTQQAGKMLVQQNWSLDTNEHFWYSI